MVDAMELHNAPDRPFAVPVTRRSPEWGWLEYLLHASCSSYRIRLRSAWSVANKRLNVDFDARCKGWHGEGGGRELPQGCCSCMPGFQWLRSPMDRPWRTG